jgi:hypothetical protein
MTTMTPEQARQILRLDVLFSLFAAWLPRTEAGYFGPVLIPFPLHHLFLHAKFHHTSHESER